MSDTEPRIVALGDSITAATTGDWPPAERWAPRVEAALRGLFPGRRITMINAGVGGNTSREGLARFDKDVTAHRPAVVLIQFGGNDATPEPDRHVTPEELDRNLAVMIDRCRAMAAAPVLLTFPPVIDAWHGWPPEPFREIGGVDWYVEQYREATRRVAAREGVALVEIDLALRAAMRRGGVASQLMPDGVHLNPGGNLTVALAVVAVIGGLVAERGGRNE